VGGGDGEGVYTKGWGVGMERECIKQLHEQLSGQPTITIYQVFYYLSMTSGFNEFL
jgi:hypothetical protein